MKTESITKEKHHTACYQREHDYPNWLAVYGTGGKPQPDAKITIIGNI